MAVPSPKAVNKDEQQQQDGKGSFYRSRTDSGVAYSPNSPAEAPASAFYINKKGELDMFVLLKVGFKRLFPVSLLLLKL